MDLQTYCERSGGTARRGCPVLTRLAGETGFSAATLYMVAKRHKRPSGVMAKKLEAATGGAVTRAEQRADIFGSEGEGT